MELYSLEIEFQSRLNLKEWCSLKKTVLLKVFIMVDHETAESNLAHRVRICRVCPGDQPLTKKPENSGYEIAAECTELALNYVV